MTYQITIIEATTSAVARKIEFKKKEIIKIKEPLWRKGIFGKSI